MALTEGGRPCQGQQLSTKLVSRRRSTALVGRRGHMNSGMVAAATCSGPGGGQSPSSQWPRKPAIPEARTTLPSTTRYGPGRASIVTHRPLRVGAIQIVRPQWPQSAGAKATSSFAGESDIVNAYASAGRKSQYRPAMHNGHRPCGSAILVLCSRRARRLLGKGRSGPSVKGRQLNVSCTARPRPAVR
jgi:hypothetical protein